MTSRSSSVPPTMASRFRPVSLMVRYSEYVTLDCLKSTIFSVLILFYSSVSDRICHGNAADSEIITNCYLKMKSVLWSAHCLLSVTRP